LPGSTKNLLTIKQTVLPDGLLFCGKMEFILMVSISVVFSFGEDFLRPRSVGEEPLFSAKTVYENAQKNKEMI